ncbi:hypothetical protein PTSG_11203 [Salpingoeca rosetta]|uniref:F-box/LRR-repeat protein 15-like leucin rich repeat domain-containing protein n=1 Tax=Salpingoeca rosetta (strain ATCC 50818 / BSB-021) TaxID=946362 RepID=F2USQ4_SALR5|nr:uncharacterized protein PTSG_11203 [Salpingoeca rosetta]EGD81163.1 hypothetical protein PTSG_11203 [Salpingoeca rosetta]|eukprot:XP_004987848.1 hypothetical protein PTSG_11203 [Salpingoeca rosetta]
MSTAEEDGAPTVSDEMRELRQEKLSSALGKVKAAAKVKRARALSQENAAPSSRWAGDVVLKRWEMPLLCKDLQDANLHIPELRLDGNELTLQQTQELAQALASNTTLRVLSLAGCGLGDEHMQALSQALASTTVKQLSVWGNAIGDEGASALAAALPSCQSLQSLDCGQNHIGDTGAHALIVAAPKCKHLKSINVSYNHLSTSAVLDFAKCFEATATITFLGLRGNAKAPSRGLQRTIRRVQRLSRPRVIDTDVLPYHREFDWRRASTLRSYVYRPQHILGDELKIQALNLSGW